MNPIDQLREITKKRVWLTSRGNQSIMQALIIAKAMGKDEVLIPDQGGWLTFRTLPGLLGMKVKEIKTEDALIDPTKLECTENNVLLLASLAGYFVGLDMERINDVAHKKGSLVIDDISGSIGRNVCPKSDIAICSFGRWKPIDLGQGGMVGISPEINIALGDSIDVLKSLDKFNGDAQRLSTLINDVANRQERLRTASSSIKKDLNKYDIVYQDGEGINVMIRCQGDDKKDILNYCQSKGFEYTECPRYIRLNCEGISIEVKRMR